jgi:hypothetical protein
MSLGFLLWVVALICTLLGLVSVLRERLVTGALLIVSGLTLGLLSTSETLS